MSISPTNIRRYPTSFPPSFVAYCQENHLTPELFHSIERVIPRIPRYVRLNASGWSRYLREEANVGSGSLQSTENGATWEEDTVSLQLANALGIEASDVKRVAWLPDWCFSIPRSVSIHDKTVFRSGAVYAMDAASVATVVALRPRPEDVVLDLCCCPGMKLAVIADTFSRKDDDVNANVRNPRSSGYAVGVDVSLNRLFVARAVLRKYNLRHAALAWSDGRVFSPVAFARSLDLTEDAKVSSLGLTASEQRHLKLAKKRADRCRATGREESTSSTSKRPREDVQERSETASREEMSSASPASQPLVIFAPAELRNAMRSGFVSSTMEEQFDNKYDRVLVDVECSHDGSLAHLSFASSCDQVSSVECPPSHGDGGGGSDEANRPATNAYRMERMNISVKGSKSEEMEPTEAMGCAATQGSQETPSNLFNLQLDLLMKGFKLLVAGGTLVYSTCSFSQKQNEDVILRFMEIVNGNAAAERRQATLLHPFAYHCEKNRSAGDSAETLECVTASSSLGVWELRSEELQELNRILAPPPQSQNGNYDDDDDNVCIETFMRGCAIAAAPEEWCCATCNPERVWGIRFWPQRTLTSFQFISKIKKEW